MYLDYLTIARDVMILNQSGSCWENSGHRSLSEGTSTKNLLKKLDHALYLKNFPHSWHTNVLSAVS
jgi:hypothetical protein